MLSFRVRQIVIAIKKGKNFDLPHVFGQQTRSLFSKRDWVTKNFETQVFPWRQIPVWKRKSRSTFRNYKSETCRSSKSLVSLNFPLERPWKRNKMFSARDCEVRVSPHSHLFSINACLDFQAVKKAYFLTVSLWKTIMNSLLVFLEKWHWGEKSGRS